MILAINTLDLFVGFRDYPYVGEQHPDYDNVEISLIELPTARHEQ